MDNGEAERRNGTRRDDLAEALRRADLFRMVEPRVIDELAALGIRKSWPAGATLFQRGDEGDYLLAVTEGRVRLTIATAQGRELVLRHVRPGEVLGEFSLIDGQPRSTDATTVEPTKGIVLRREGFLRVANARPDLGMSLARHLCAQLRATNFQMESIALYELQMRVVRYYLATLHERHGASLPDEAELQIGFNQAELAAALGASRPKVNRVLQVLLAEGVLRRDGQRLFGRSARLQRIVAEDASRGLI